MNDLESEQSTHRGAQPVRVKEQLVIFAAAEGESDRKDCNLRQDIGEENGELLSDTAPPHGDGHSQTQEGLRDAQGVLREAWRLLTPDKVESSIFRVQ